MNDEYKAEEKRIMRTIYDWKVVNNTPVPPKNELPECIKKRINWAVKLVEEVPITIVGELKLVVVNPENEQKTKKEFETIISDWLPLDDDYKKYYQEYQGFMTFTIPMAVAVQLVYGGKN